MKQQPLIRLPEDAIYAGGIVAVPVLIAIAVFSNLFGKSESGRRYDEKLREVSWWRR